MCDVVANIKINKLVIQKYSPANRIYQGIRDIGLLSGYSFIVVAELEPRAWEPVLVRLVFGQSATRATGRAYNSYRVWHNLTSRRA